MLPLIKGVAGAVVGFAIGWGLMAAGQIAIGNDPGGPAALVSAYLVALIGWLFGVGMWRIWAREWVGKQARYEVPEKGLGRYLRFNTDHKVIGIQYLGTFVVVFLLAGALAMVVRYELMDAVATFDPDFYNQVMSLHGILMIAVAVAALLGGFGNYLVPLMIGARDLAFPRLNALSYWLVPPVAVLLLAAPFAGGFDSGWTAYPPLSETNANGQLFFLLAVITFGLSSILGGLNFLTTITRMRAPGMGWFRMPIFVWSVFAASLISLLFTQYFAASLIMVLLDRVAGMGFFDASRGGAALLYEHLFWFYSHPAVYVMILPGFGITLEVITHFSRKPLFGYPAAVAGFLGIVVLSGIVWAHHMFTSGMASWLHAPFMVLTELISIPTGLIFLCAIGTMWQGRIWLTTPMLFAIFVLLNFTVGGTTGIYLADVATDIHLQDTYFVVAHFHYTIVGGEIFAMFAGLYYWFPKITGRTYNETAGRVQAVWMFLGFAMTFVPLFMAGVNGMNRRVNEYTTNVELANTVASISAFVLGAGFLIFVVNMLYSAVRGKQSGANPWGATTLEWQTSSPPPAQDFDEIPQVIGDPYPYGESDKANVRFPVAAGAPAGGGGR
jgi:cytochrome c oxidase subunit 1